MINKRYIYYVGIDPDIDKSGFSIVDKELKKIISATTYTFFDMETALLHFHSQCQQKGIQIVVIVEAGWLNKISSYHTYKDNEGKEKRIVGARAQKIAQDVGRNQQVGILLVEYCKRQGIDVIEASPLRKGWKGPKGKITHDELAYFTGITGQSNQEVRDAILLAWEYAGLPIKIKVGK